MDKDNNLNNNLINESFGVTILFIMILLLLLICCIIYKTLFPEADIQLIFLTGAVGILYI